MSMSKSTLLFAEIFEQADQDRQAVELWLKRLTPHQVRELRQITDRARPDSHGYGIVETLRPALISILKDQAVRFDHVGFCHLTQQLAEALPNWAKGGLCKHEHIERGSCRDCGRYIGTRKEGL